MNRIRIGIGLVALLLAGGNAWQARAQAPAPKNPAPAAPVPLTRTALLKRLAQDEEIRKGLSEQITALGGKPDAVLAGTAAAKPGEDVKDQWHQGVVLTPRDSELLQNGKQTGLLVAYNVFMHSLKDCLQGNYLPILCGPGSGQYAAAGLYDLPGAADAEHPWIAEVGFEMTDMKSDQIRLQVNHEPIPAARLGDTTLLGFVNVNGGKHFVEITQPPADPAHRTRRFWYTRMMRL